MTTEDRIIESKDRFSPAERKVAELALADPASLAFGTVAEVASRAGTSGPTVVRCARRLGFGGFADLQAAVRGEVGERLRPATERIRERSAADVVGRTLAAEVENVHTTLSAVDPATFRTATDLLARRSRRLFVLSGDASHGVAHQLAAQLDLLRSGVVLLAGSAVRVSRTLAHLAPGDVVVAIDYRRYERWVLAAAAEGVRRDADLIAITDSPLSPLADGARCRLIVAAASPGPFDSHVGTLALANALVTAVAARLRRPATDRLDLVEEAWRANQDLLFE